MRRNYCVFILSYGRASEVTTLKKLRSQGYTGDTYIVVSDDDPELLSYRQKYGDILIEFNREEAIKETDTDFMDNMSKFDGVVCARNYLFKIAKDMGVDYFIELDDDYSHFAYRYKKDGKLLQRQIKNLDIAFESSFKFLDDTNARVISWSQGGDLIGGISSNWKNKVLRKAMNSFFCKTDRPFRFFGRINEDTNMYCYYGSRGDLVLQITDLMINQATTQKNEHGMTDLYLNYGTYLKSYYSVMIQPSSVIIKQMGVTNFRLHHQIKWNNTVPKIINEKYRKG